MLIGLVLLGAGLLLVVIAAPRHGQVVGFLRNRDTLQYLYVMLMIILITLGGALTLSGWHWL